MFNAANRFQRNVLTITKPSSIERERENRGAKINRVPVICTRKPAKYLIQPDPSQILHRSFTYMGHAHNVMLIYTSVNTMSNYRTLKSTGVNLYIFQCKINSLLQVINNC